jgi:hypothetical protein
MALTQAAGQAAPAEVNFQIVRAAARGFAGAALNILTASLPRRE